MPLTNQGLQDMALAFQGKYVYAQLHTAAGGAAHTSNVSAAGRVSVSWSVPVNDGDFDIASPLAFTGGAPSGPVYSVSLWNQLTGGVCGGEFLVTGDTSFNAAGEYTVTSIGLNGSST